MFGSFRSVLKRGVVVAGLALIAAVPLMTPSTAHAWWYRGVWHPYGWHPYGWHAYGWRPGVVVVRPGVVVGGPRVVYAPRRVWIPAHWSRGYLIPGHWG